MNWPANAAGGAAAGKAGLGAAMGSKFLTAGAAALGQGIASGAFGGTSHRKMRRDHRLQLRNQYKHYYLPTARHAHKTWKSQQQWYRRNIAQKALQDRVKDAKAAGVHPLVAMGLAPSAAGPGPATGQTGPGYTNIIPGQSDVGSAIETGINTYLDLQAAERQARDLADRRLFDKQMQKMQLAEQALRNDWLMQQIKSSAAKSAGIRANASQPQPGEVVELGMVDRPPNIKDEPLVTAARPPEHTSPNTVANFFGMKIYPKPGEITAQGIEDLWGESLGWLASPFLFIRDLGYTLDKYHWNPSKKNWAKGRQSIEPFSP